jgi:hypothetical protein
MKACRQFLALNAGDRRVVVEAAALVLVVRAGLALLPFPVLRRLLTAYSRWHGRSRPSAGAAHRIGVIVTRVAARLPVRTTCLVDALVADTMLRRRRFSSTFRLGVQRPADAHGGLAAHAWVECDGAVLIGALDGLGDYAILSAPRIE